MAVQYNRLWKLLIDMKMKKTALKSAAGVSANVMARLGKDEYISLESIEKICAGNDAIANQTHGQPLSFH